VATLGYNFRSWPKLSIKVPAFKVRYLNLMTVTLDDKQLKRFERDLKAFAAKALPFANRDSLNDGVFMAQRVARKQILPRKMILRNQWAQGRVQVQKAKQKRIRDQLAIVGGAHEILERQEFGGTRSGRGKHGVPIPTRSASGEGRGTAPRRRVVRPANTLPRIRLRKGAGGIQGRKRRNVVAVRQAVGRGRKRKQKRITLDTRKGPGIFEVRGTVKNPDVEMLWGLWKPTVRTPPNPWLKPTIDIVAQQMPSIYRTNLSKQLRRHKIFAR